MTDLAVRTKGKRRLQHGMEGSGKYKERGRGTKRMFTFEWEKLQGQRVLPGGARAVLAEGAEKGGMKRSLERPKDVPCFSLGAWKVSREWRARNNPFLFIGKLTLSWFIRHKARHNF